MWASNFFIIALLVLLTVNWFVKIGVLDVREDVLVVVVLVEMVVLVAPVVIVLVRQYVVQQTVSLDVLALVNLAPVVPADVRTVIIGQVANVVEITVKDVMDALEHVVERAPTVVILHV